MKTNSHNVLLIADHPIITSAYQETFQKVASLPPHRFNIRTALSYQEALKKLDYYRVDTLHLMFIDLELPPYEAMKIYTGQDFVLYVKRNFPATKVAIITRFTSDFKIYNLVKHLSPDAFLVKSEFTNELMENCIKELVENPPFYTKKVIQSLRKNLSNDMLLDKIDMKLLYHISIGVKTKDLPALLHLSIASIERRKKRLRDLFGIDDDKNDNALIIAAREKGFV
ncbi:hypothetical protein RBU60_11800 [Mesonia sp. MT50]|uniref:Response regulatory domain-containing protein n=1 Tax=Mesonia profundi TaxID=3070998 RepID=A0ABU1A4Q1_9FLAO|nr:hypothetical protein [Mesonia profundi]MDQ7918261.1 hypothetical protein [Mesonia profundi]